MPETVSVEPRVPSGFPRICHLVLADAAKPSESLGRIAALGFSHVLISDAPEGEALSVLVRQCAVHGLAPLLDLEIFDVDLAHPLVEECPECFAVRREHTGAIVDPRHLAPAAGRALARPSVNPEVFLAWWTHRIATLLDAGVAGFRACQPHRTGGPVWRALIAAAHQHARVAPLVIADTPGATREEILGLADCGFDFCLSSLPWWDGRASWLVEEAISLSHVAPVIAQADSTTKLAPASGCARRARLEVAAVTGAGILVPWHFLVPASHDDPEADIAPCVKAVNDLIASDRVIAAQGQLRTMTGPGAPITVLMRTDASDARIAENALFAVINPHMTVASDLGESAAAALARWTDFETLLGGARPADKLRPGEARLLRARRAKVIAVAVKPAERTATSAAKEPRIVIGGITPSVDGSAFPVKRIAGDQVRIEADIFTDGHPVLGAELLHRAEDERAWTRTPMLPAENDRWFSHLTLHRMGRHRFVIEAWVDVYGTFVRDLIKKRDAHADIELDILEGRLLVETAKGRATGAVASALHAILTAFADLSGDDRLALLIAPETREAMRRADTRPFRAQSAVHPIDAERTAARFASWYELFPRSQTHDPEEPGTLRSVIGALPRIRDMGFDVLYFTPIHPIGRTNRKGKNNALMADPEDVGSPYAIGADEGGHDTIHPALGTLDDFRAVVAAAHRHGMEIALDFAIQCSPDHPWLKQHPGWFAWRPDGSMKYAENPPKKYEDIVNVEFYASDAVPDLWVALRDVVRFWIAEGVKIFRVDNPHTKPFAFWKWLIQDIRAGHPDVIFLSEAFTRPKIMYHLAKVGFSQSYTYFIWRNSKAELTAYMTELNALPVCDFFRPHFFVNTPDINPHFLQTSGRPGFLIRAALAATLSGLWGVYSGFEVCEAVPLSGREEYLDAEKYEIRVRDWHASFSIASEIAQLNRLRKSEPALQTHLGLTFYNVFNDQILYYGKKAPAAEDRVLVAVSLNPHGAEEADYEIPLWEWELPDNAALDAEDLLTGQHMRWYGKIQHMRLTPDRPYAIWRVKPATEV